MKTYAEKILPILKEKLDQFKSYSVLIQYFGDLSEISNSFSDSLKLKFNENLFFRLLNLGSINDPEIFEELQKEMNADDKKILEVYRKINSECLYFSKIHSYNEWLYFNSGLKFSNTENHSTFSVWCAFLMVYLQLINSKEIIKFIVTGTLKNVPDDISFVSGLISSEKIEFVNVISKI